MIAWYWSILDTPYCEMTLRKVLSLLLVLLFIWAVGWVVVQVSKQD